MRNWVGSFTQHPEEWANKGVNADASHRLRPPLDGRDEG